MKQSEAKACHRQPARYLLEKGIHENKYHQLGEEVIRSEIKAQDNQERNVRNARLCSNFMANKRVLFF